MKNKILVGLGALLPFAALAEGEGATPAYETAVSQLQTLGTNAAASISPMVVAVGVSFVGITLALVAIRYFRRGAK